MNLLENDILRCCEEDCGQIFQVTHTKQGNIEVCPFCQGDVDYAYAKDIDDFLVAQYKKR